MKPKIKFDINRPRFNVRGSNPVFDNFLSQYLNDKQFIGDKILPLESRERSNSFDLTKKFIGDHTHMGIRNEPLEIESEFVNKVDSGHPFTIIAVKTFVDSLNYHKERRWFALFEQAEEAAAVLVAESTNRDVELAIVKAVGIVRKIKPVTPTRTEIFTSTKPLVKKKPIRKVSKRSK